MIRFISISLCVNILVTGSSEVRIPLKCHSAARLPQQAKALDCVCRCRYRTQDSGILDGREKPCGKREMCSAFADRMACGHGSSVAPPTKTTLRADRLFFFFCIQCCSECEAIRAEGGVPLAGRLSQRHCIVGSDGFGDCATRCDDWCVGYLELTVVTRRLLCDVTV